MPTRVSSPVFVGRRPELARLLEAYEEAKTTRSSLILLGGDAGVGKTRLLTEFLDRADADGAHVLIGGCVELGSEGVPFAPLVEALRGLSRSIEAVRLDHYLGPARADLARLLPELGPASEAGTVFDPAVGRTGRLLESVLALLQRVSRDQPVVFALEDIHWADHATLDLVRLLSHGLPADRVVVVATFRTDELHRTHPLRPLVAELARRPTVQRIDLRAFDRDELTEQLRAILDEEPATELVDEILARSEGNAFYAEELLATTGPEEGLPPGLREILLHRFTRLSTDAARVLRVSAAVGREVDHRLLRRVARIDDDRLMEALREMVAHQILIPDQDGSRYRFRHALVQEAAYGELLPGEHTEVHAAIARALTDDPTLGKSGSVTVDAELAHHWFSAHELERAFEASVAAGRAAERVFASTEALRHYERALALWDRVPPDVRDPVVTKPRLLASAAEMCLAGTDARRGIELLRQALGMLDDADPTAGFVRERLSVVHYVLGEVDASLEVVEAAVRTTPADPPTPERARVLAWYGRLLMLLGRYADAVAPSREAVDVAREIGARAEEGQAINSLGTALASVGEVEEAVPLLERSIEIALASGSVEDVARGYTNITAVLSDAANDLDGALRWGWEGLAWLEERGLGHGWFVALNVADTLIRLGRWEEARALLADYDPGDRSSISELYLLYVRAELATYQDRLDEASSLLDHARSWSLVKRGYWRENVALCDALVACLGGRPEEVRDVVRRLEELQDGASTESAMAPVLAVGAWAEADQAVRARAQGDDAGVEEARRLTEVYLDRLRGFAAELAQHRGSGWAPILRVDAALARAEAERIRLEGRSDPAAWIGAMGLTDETHFAFDRAYVRYRWAEAVVATADDRAEAEEAVRRASEFASSVGAPWVSSRVGELARRARVSIVTDDASEQDVGPTLLTPREREVLELVVTGLTNREIGEKLYISDKTASVHVSNILAKLEVSSRTEAATEALRRGLVRA